MSGEMVEVKIQGLSELKARLEQLPQKIATRIEKTAMRRGVDILAAAVDARRPKSVTGELRAKLFSTIRKTKAGVKAVFGDKARYTHLVEFGHRMVGHKPNKKQSSTNPVIPPHPFFRPAFDESAERIIDAISQGIAEELNRIEK